MLLALNAVAAVTYYAPTSTTETIYLAPGGVITNHSCLLSKTSGTDVTLASLGSKGFGNPTNLSTSISTDYATFDVKKGNGKKTCKIAVTGCSKVTFCHNSDSKRIVVITATPTSGDADVVNGSISTFYTEINLDGTKSYTIDCTAIQTSDGAGSDMYVGAIVLTKYVPTSTETPSFTTDLSSAYNTDTKTTLPLSVVAAHQTGLKWYEATSTTADPANDTQLGTGASYDFSKTTAGTYYVYCRAYNENATGEKYTNSTVATITVEEAAKSDKTDLTNLVLDNGCNTAIVGTAITGYYMQGAAVPGVKSITLSDGATYAINGTTLTVTAEDGTTTQDYTYTLNPVDPLTSTVEQELDDETPWVKMATGWKSEKNSYELFKAVDEPSNMRITEGKNRAYIFVGPCDAVVITNTSSNMTTDRANSTYAVNGAAAVSVTLPKSTGSIMIPCDPSRNNMIEIVNNGTGSWGFDKVDMLTKAELDVNNTLFYGKAKNSVQLDVVHQAEAVEVTSEYADITGGKMYAFDGHASSDAAMVIYGQFNINSSGASYVHIKLDNALKAGDVIYTENGNNLLVANFYVSTTSSKGSKTYLFPYEVTAGSDLENATDLYIFKNTGYAFSVIKVVGDKVITTTVVDGAENAFATYCGSQNFTATVGTIYKGSVNGNTVTLTCVNPTGDEIIPAYTGVVISTEGNGSVTITNTSAAATADMLGNELYGTTSRIETPANCMALNSDEGKFQSYSGAYFPANKAYLVNPSSANLRVSFGEATAIKTVEAAKNNVVRYNLAGQRVNASAKGIIVVNGKKVLK